MKENQKIQMSPKVVYNLDKTELKRLYTTLALAQYRWLRQPEYADHAALRTLQKDLKRFYTEILSVAEREPNNLTLNRMINFFDLHYKQIKGIIDELPQ